MSDTGYFHFGVLGETRNLHALAGWSRFRSESGRVYLIHGGEIIQISHEYITADYASKPGSCIHEDSFKVVDGAGRLSGNLIGHLPRLRIDG